MKNLLLVLALAFGIASCNKEPEPLTKQEIKHKIDSLTAERIRESDEQAKRDLSHRMKIEVKVKVDSILNAEMAKKDTIAKANPVQPR
jgi:PBP1b-binding outer membrane lipoprotein LpoB